MFELDEAGYPTEETLNKIEEWSFASGYDNLMKEIADLLEPCGAAVKVEHDKWIVITGGWSGNESIIHALERNSNFWFLCWYLTRRGGYYEFVVKELEDFNDV